MATTTSSKAKTKTTQKRVVKSAATTKKTTAKKPATKRVASKTITKKPAAKLASAATTKKTTAKKPVKLEQKAAVAGAKVTTDATTPLLNRVQVLTGLLYAGLAVAAGFLMSSTTVQTFISHLTKDELASKTGTVLAPAAHVLYEIEIRWMLVAFLGVAAVIALLRGTRYFNQEEAGIKRKLQPTRWVDFAVTGAMAFSIVGLLNGIQDIVALKIGAISIVLAAWLAWVYERENAATGKPARAVYSASALAVLLPVLALIATIGATVFYGMERSPWYAYAAAAALVTWLLVTVRMPWNWRNAQDYFTVNRSYDRLAAVAKIALALILIYGLYDK